MLFLFRAFVDERYDAKQAEVQREFEAHRKLVRSLWIEKKQGFY